LFLFAHSMGSFIAQGYAIRNGKRLAGLILSGTNYQHPIIYYAGRLVAKLESFRLKESDPSSLMDKLSFASFNNNFKPNRTNFDWLSRDTKEVDKYINDPFCGFPCSAETWHQLLTGLIEISQKDQLSKIPDALPIYLFGGDEDPVGRMGKGIPALAQKLRQTGHDNVTHKIYEDARHEMLNETCKYEVYQDVADWISQQF
jgi:alpha-beta hydrolase superfamily lysophospholipase